MGVRLVSTRSISLINLSILAFLLFSWRMFEVGAGLCANDVLSVYIKVDRGPSEQVGIVLR